MKKIVLLLSLGLASPVFAQTQVGGPIPLSPSQNSLAIITATSLTVPAGTNYATVCANGGAANWETDGVTVPTGTVGTGGSPLSTGSCMALSGSKTIQNFQAIQQVGSTTTLSVKYFKYQ